MKNGVVVLLVTIFVTSIGLNADCVAQRGGRRGGGWSAGSVYNRMYDVTTVTTISGEVASVEQFVPYAGAPPGVHLIVATGSESISVHLGPAWFIENQDEVIDVGDAVTVTGSRIVYLEQAAIIAASVQTDGAALLLRDWRGIPVWSGWRRR